MSRRRLSRLVSVAVKVKKTFCLNFSVILSFTTMIPPSHQMLAEMQFVKTEEQEKDFVVLCVFVFHCGDRSLLKDLRNTTVDTHTTKQCFKM